MSTQEENNSVMNEESHDDASMTDNVSSPLRFAYDTVLLSESEENFFPQE